MYLAGNARSNAEMSPADRAPRLAVRKASELRALTPQRIQVPATEARRTSFAGSSALAVSRRAWKHPREVNVACVVAYSTEHIALHLAAAAKAQQLLRPRSIKAQVTAELDGPKRQTAPKCKNYLRASVVPNE